MLVARYTAKASGVVPTFNSGYQYTIDETVSNGIYTVEINSDTDFTSCSFRSNSNLLTIEYLKVTNKVTSMSNMFRGCSQLTQVDASNWNTSKVIKMHNMFEACSKLTQLDLSNWDTNKVTETSSMFYGCSNLNNIIMYNSDYNSVNKIISVLPSRSVSDPGGIYISGVYDISKVDVITAKSKHWDLYVDHIYKAKMAQCNAIMIGNKKIGTSYIIGTKKI